MLLTRLGSDQPGDVTNAARAIVKALAAENMDLHDLASILTQSGPRRDDGPPHQERREPPRSKPSRASAGASAFAEGAAEPETDWQKVATFCVSRSGLLKPNESEFVHDIYRKLVVDQYARLSVRQRSYLLDIERRIRDFDERRKARAADENDFRKN
jgi:hypothetical protein